MAAAAPKLDGVSWALLLALALLWSASFIFIKVAAEEIPVLTLVLARVGIAALTLHAFVLLTRRPYPTQPAVLARYALMGFVNNVLPFALITYATWHTGAGAASILNATSPIFALLVAHVTTADEKITSAKLAGILVGVGGVAAMVGPQALSGLVGQSDAAGAMLLASFFYGVAAVLGRSFGGIDATVSATCQLSASTLMLASARAVVRSALDARIAERNRACLAGRARGAVDLVGYVIYWALIRRAGGTNTILVTLLIPVGTRLLRLGDPRRGVYAGGGRRHGSDRAGSGGDRRPRASASRAAGGDPAARND